MTPGQGGAAQRPTQDLSGDALVVRVVRPGEVTEVEGADGIVRLRPKSSEFAATLGANEGMSVFLVDDLPDEFDAADILTCGLFEEGSTLWISTLSVYRDEGLQIVRDDIPELPGHGLLRKPDGGRFNSGLRTRLAKRAKQWEPRDPQ